MKLTRILMLLLVLLSAGTAHAIVLRGVVTEVRDGQTMVINLQNGQKLLVALRGVDAPELQQEFGAASRQHLAKLVLNKPVEIDFSGAIGSPVVTRVMSQQVDIALQLIRDGAVWYDRKNDPDLTESERTLFALAEKLAREERRGIWQNGSPVPPWEWRRTQEEKSSTQSLTRPLNGNSQGLQKDDLILTARGSSTNATANSSKNSIGSKSVSAKPPSTRLNTPGQDADFRSYFSADRVSIVYFYAEWCPACQGLTPVMAEINKSAPDMQVLFMDIDDWGTPVAQKYGITSVPHLKVYDKSGVLIAEGRAAREWMTRQIAKQ